MIYVDLHEKQPRRLSFYLAIEEFVARYMNVSEDCFFMWQVEPSVIFGRNQVAENEVNIPYCREHGIQMYRRKSGGGCVYADMSNVMLSYITNDENVDVTFTRYLSMFAEALQRLGIDAQKNDHNDIMIGDKKVSGNAIYHLPGKNIAHGTLPRQKLDKHGVESVRQRICLLKDYTDIPFAEIRKQLREMLCDTVYSMTAEDVKIVEEIEKEYLSEDFIKIPLS